MHLRHVITTYIMILSLVLPLVPLSAWAQTRDSDAPQMSVEGSVVTEPTRSDA